ncbi:MAG TPA: DNA ligase D [Solirubrobacteraceae bacterium]|jgi:bifunctional non-homologous end joining protein LigD|nr:DNA ligase D [Solirubrobacteraceae bacterium]
MAIQGSKSEIEQATARLARYDAKRDFASTPEPAAGGSAAPAGIPATGASVAAGDALRFVIHEHHATRLHWDLRLERDGALASWAVPKGLPPAPGENHLAVAVEDHPLEYLQFEAEIPKGQYGAGKIEIWDSGTYECLKWEPRKVEVALHGERVDARYALFPIDAGEHPKNWLIHRMDPAADPRREPMPARIAPMLARSGELPREDGGWAYEVKWDGVRALAYSQPGELRLESRNLKDIGDSYPELFALNAALGSHSAVLDGEVVALDGDGRPSFEALAKRMHVSSRAQARKLAKSTPVTYVIFDVLWLDGHSLMREPYERRRARLAELGLSDASWQTPEHVVGEGKALLAATAEQQLEGVVAKRLASTYQPGARTRDWVKVKTVARQEFVVGGWMPGKGKRSDSVGALLLGVYEGAREDGPAGGGGRRDDDHGSGQAQLRFVGRVGSGFSDEELQRLSRLLAPLARSTSPFTSGAKPPREALFCEPRLVAEVKFASWTAGGSLRAPTYKGLREDKPAEQIVREDATREGSAHEGSAHEGAVRLQIVHEGEVAHTIVDGRELKLSNLDKVLYPRTGFTKGELIEYYAEIAPVLLSHLAGRPLTVTRWPDGVEAKSFFQKQAPAHRPKWVRTATVASANKPIDYTLADDLPTLVWLANLAAIELHVPLSRAAAMDRPTSLVFDLDPGAPATIVECCHVALQLQGMFEHLGLDSFAKTSGSKGLQVYVPLNCADVTYERTKPFAKAVAELLEGAEPNLVVSRMTKARRTGKVLIDWSQNDAKKTTVCAYSLRAGERPTASTPLDWDEVRAGRDSGDPSSLVFEALQVLERVSERGDLMAPVLSLAQKLPD